MFKFWYEKLVSIIMPLFVFVSLFSVIFYAYYTVVSIPPADEVSFIKDMRKEAAKPNSAIIVDMSKPHLTDKELRNWINQAVSESLSFSKENYSETAKKIRSYFTEGGFEKFQDYLISSGIAENIRVNSYRMSVYIDNRPILLNSSEMNNVYKWLYQIPVVVSFFPTDQKRDASESDEFVNRTLNLRLQITRTKIEENSDALQIENWIVTGG